MIDKEYLTSSQSRERLDNMAASTFYRLVDAGKIGTFTPIGKKQKVYVREDVEVIAKAMHLNGDASIRRLVPDSSGMTDWVQPQDLPYTLAMDYELYGIEGTLDMAITKPWWEKNPYLSRLLFDKDNRKDMWGGITILPMSEETIFKLLKGEIHEREITATDIFVYESGKTYYGYVASAVIRPEHRNELSRLLNSVFSFWCDQYPTVQLSKIYASAYSKEGLGLIKHLFFSPRYDLGKDIYELEPYRYNPSKVIQRFQHCIAEKGGRIE